MKLLALAAVLTSVSGPAPKPNIVLILADDVGVDCIGCYGGESYPTPSIDRLAATGMQFQHGYSMPSCHPTRVCLLTGRYPARLGNPRWGSFPRALEQETITHLVRSSGYATAVAGKWQLTILGDDLDQPNRMGFDHYCLFGWHEGPRYYQPLIWQDGHKRAGVEGRFGPDVYCDYLIQFIRDHRNQPFFAYYPMALCHDVTDDLAHPVPYGPRGRYDSFAEMAANMDRLVGRLVAAIDEMGLRQRTLIFFTGDNGTASRSIIRAEGGKYLREPVYSIHNGHWVQGGKTRLTDGGTRVPLIANWQGTIQSGQQVDDLVDFSDWYATLAELVGAKIPQRIDSKSFASRLTGAGPGPRTWAYSEARNRYWVRTQRWKLYNDGRIFDMQRDPQETQSIEDDQLPSEVRRVLAGARKEVAR